MGNVPIKNVGQVSLKATSYMSARVDRTLYLLLLVHRDKPKIIFMFIISEGHICIRNLHNQYEMVVFALDSIKEHR